MNNNDNFLADLKNNNNLAYESLYKSYFPTIEKYIFQNNGTREDAQDVFQETLMIFHKNFIKESFELTSSLKTYLYSIGRHLWLKKLNRRQPVTSIEDDCDCDKLNLKAEQSEDQNEEKLKQYITDLMAKIPEHCQKIVQYVYYDGLPIDEVAAQLGYNNAHTASNAKYKCLQHIKKESGMKQLKQLWF